VIMVEGAGVETMGQGKGQEKGMGFKGSAMRGVSRT
jgi:hypothetical protein